MKLQFCLLAALFVALALAEPIRDELKPVNAPEADLNQDETKLAETPSENKDNQLNGKGRLQLVLYQPRFSSCLNVSIDMLNKIYIALQMDILNPKIAQRQIKTNLCIFNDLFWFAKTAEQHSVKNRATRK